jgi:hypothetical protein
VSVCECVCVWVWVWVRACVRVCLVSERARVQSRAVPSVAALSLAAVGAGRLSAQCTRQTRTTRRRSLSTSTYLSGTCTCACGCELGAYGANATGRPWDRRAVRAASILSSKGRSTSGGSSVCSHTSFNSSAAVARCRTHVPQQRGRERDDTHLRKTEKGGEGG